MKYKVIKVKRLFHGFASIRDFQVKEAKEKGLGLEIWWDNEFIHVPFEELDKGFINDEIFTSKHTQGQTYKLIDYDWSPYRKKTSQEPLQFNIFALQFNIFDSLINL